MKITLVRHGETDNNKNNIMQGLSNELMNDRGRRQCKKLRNELKDKHFDICYMSPLVRCVETAMILVGDRVPIVKDRRLIERDIGKFEGTVVSEVQLKSEYKIESIEIVFNPNNARNAAFEIWTSLDGKTWETVFVGSGDGSVEEGSWEKFVLEIPSSARWIRYVANGSNKSEWNGVKEIRFEEAK